MDQVDCLKTRVMLEAVEALQRETALETRRPKPGDGEAVGERIDLFGFHGRLFLSELCNYTPA